MVNGMPGWILMMILPLDLKMVVQPILNDNVTSVRNSEVSRVGIILASYIIN